MKRIFNLATTILVASLILAGCKKDDLLYDGPSLAHFTTPSATFYVEEQDTVYRVPVGLTKAFDTDMTFTVQVVEDGTTAVDGEQYRLRSTQVTIPAGQVIGYIEVEGIFENVATPTNLVLALDSTGSSAQFYQTFTLKIQQFCKFVQEEFVGTYFFSSAWWEDEYEVDAVADPNNPNAIIFKDLYDIGYDVTVVFNDDNKNNIFVSVAQQPAWYNSTYGDVYLMGGTGTFNGCEKTLTYSTAHGVPGLGTFSGTDTPTLVKID